jgi:ABC-type multidrug transport system fused ATPase/permease subunit
MAVAPQRMVAFSGTIAQNIALGASDGEIDKDRIVWLLERLDILHPIMALPNALDTELAGHFDLLSGGQFQRLALARAFYARPRFVVLDESTNALDTSTKRLVLDFIKEQAQVCLVLAINHDPDFIRASDRVLAIRNGRLEAPAK